MKDDFLAVQGGNNMADRGLCDMQGPIVSPTLLKPTHSARTGPTGVALKVVETTAGAILGSLE